ncbi:Holliday junction resolvase [Candidatus Woesearchaeota archaeon]|nr:Holliday junction resolvase [Candidatus Woesearchaeota archaeon]
MSRKSKGISAERQLLHMFWDTGKWIALRAPASGAIKYPCPDLLVGNLERKLAIECKKTKSAKQYLKKEEIEQLIEFSKIFGAEPWIAVSFDRLGWYFLNTEDLQKAGNNFVISIPLAKRKGLLFEELIECGGRDSNPSRH